MASKAHDHTFHFAGSRSRAGRMICECCHTPIVPQKQDWLAAKKSDKWDWRYVTWHRSCWNGHDGWQKLIDKDIDEATNLNAAFDELNKLRGDHSIRDYLGYLSRTFGE